MRERLKYFFISDYSGRVLIVSNSLLTVVSIILTVIDILMMLNR